MHYTIYDLETTGLVGTFADVIQFAYANLDTNFNLVKAECLYLYRPNIYWSQEAENIHHIPKSYLAQFADQYETNLKKMYITLQRANVVGFNSQSFDDVFSNTWLKRMGMPAIEFNNSYDVMRIFHPVFKRNCKLVDLPGRINLTPEIIQAIACGWFGEARGPHDASYDVTATALSFAYAVRKGYVDLEGGKEASIMSESEDKLMEKGVYELGDFSSTATYILQESTGESFFINLCSDKSKYAFIKMPTNEYTDLIMSRKYKNRYMAPEIIDSIAKIRNNSPVFKYKSSGVYEAEVAPGYIGIIENIPQSCTFSVRKDGD
jgi:DNA polymerase III alpha subunit (gram-positive type)